MTSVTLFSVLASFWSLLSRRQRLAFVSHVGLLFLSGLLDMLALLAMYGFIAGLRLNRATGERGGRIGDILDYLDVGYLTQANYSAFVGGAVFLVLLLKNALSHLGQQRLDLFVLKISERAAEAVLNAQLLRPYEQTMRGGPRRDESAAARAHKTFSDSFNGVAQILVDGLTLTLATLLLLLIQPLITLIVAVEFSAFGWLTYSVTRKRLAIAQAQELEARREVRLLLTDGSEGLLETRLRDARLTILRRYKSQVARLGRIRRSTSSLKQLPRTVNELLLAATLVGSAIGMAYWNVRLDQTLPTLAIFAFTGLRMTGAMSRVNKQLQELESGADDFNKNYQSVLDAPSSGPPSFSEQELPRREKEPVEQVTPLRLLQELRAESVRFTYAGAERPALLDLSIKIRRGEMVSICGPSGGGKSTLALVILGILRPESGQILCDETDIFEHPRAWHRSVGFVGQRAYIPSRSVRENVAFGVLPEDIDDAQVWRALKLASAVEFVREHRKGLDRWLHPNGTNLSGGQRQRLMIARALYHDPSVLILDEATTGLDAATERDIADTIYSLRESKTLICVAHRLETIRRSDRIHVMEGGKLTGQGSYEELLANHPTFQELVAAGFCEDDS